MAIKLSDFADQIKVSPQAVRKAIKEGRIKDGAIKGKRGWLIEPNLAIREWKENTNSSQQRNAPTDEKELFNKGADLPPNISYTKARAYGEQFKAKLLELEFREKAGMLVKADDVKIQQFKTVRLLRDAIENIPIRIVNEISATAGVKDPEMRHEIMLIMQREIKSALTSLADRNGIS